MVMRVTNRAVHTALRSPDFQIEEHNESRRVQRNKMILHSQLATLFSIFVLVELTKVESSISQIV